MSAVSSPYVSRISPFVPGASAGGRPGVSGTSRWCGDDGRVHDLAVGGRRPVIGADRRRRGDAVHPAQPLQPGHLLARDQVLAAEQARHQADLGEVLDRLHPVVGGEEIAGHRQRAVVGQQQPVVRLDVRANRRRQFRRRGRGVLGNRNAAQRRDHLGEHGAGERHAGHREAGGGRRMGVHHGPHVGSLVVDLEVHLQLGRGIARPRHLAPVEVGDDHHVGGHEPLRDALRGGQDAVVGQPHADVAVVGGDEALDARAGVRLRRCRRAPAARRRS